MVTKQKLQEMLDEAKNRIKTANHLIYVTYNLLKEERIFIKIIGLFAEVLEKSISAALLYENYTNKIQITRTFNLDYPVFRKIRANYGLTEQDIKVIDEIIGINKKYKSSAIDFVRKGSFVILEDDLTCKQVNQITLKDYLFKVETIVDKIENKLLTSF